MINEVGGLQEIIQGVYLGSVIAASDETLLSTCNISHILTCGPITPFFPEKFVYKVVHMDDSPEENLFSHFEDCFRFIEQRERNILIHCHAGVSRSASIMIAYLMKKEKMTYFNAHKHVSNIRTNVSPNVGFIQQLMLFEKLNYMTNEEELKENEEYKCHLSEIARSDLPTMVWDIIPADPSTNLDVLEGVVRSINIPMIQWASSRRIYLGFGVEKIRICCNYQKNEELALKNQLFSSLSSISESLIDSFKIVTPSHLLDDDDDDDDDNDDYNNNGDDDHEEDNGNGESDDNDGN